MREQHLAALWEALGGMAINPLLRYFAQDDFTGVEDFAVWFRIRSPIGLA